MRITSDDSWAALGDYKEYDPGSTDKPETQYVVTAGDASIVQVGTTHSRRHPDDQGPIHRQGAGSAKARPRGAVNSWLPAGASLADLQRETGRAAQRYFARHRCVPRPRRCGRWR
jgi:hypothetical protein